MDRKRRIHSNILKRARELRKEQTPAEQKVWRVLRNRQLEGYKFRRQHPIGRLIVDFYCPVCVLVIEIDGDVHADQEDYDRVRTEWLNEQGYDVIRFMNTQVNEQLNEVIAEILYHCKKREAELAQGDEEGLFSGE